MCKIYIYKFYIQTRTHIYTKREYVLIILGCLKNFQRIIDSNSFGLKDNSIFESTPLSILIHLYIYFC